MAVRSANIVAARGSHNPSETLAEKRANHAKRLPMRSERLSAPEVWTR